MEITERTSNPTTWEPTALLDLGLMYAAGRDVVMDLVEAHKWFSLAALRGNDAARSYRSEISREMTRMQIQAAQRRAREWLVSNGSMH